MTEGEFISNSVDALYFDLNKASLSRDESYIDSPKRLKDKNPTITPKHND